MVEPGRSIVGPAGVLLTRVAYLKPGVERSFAVVDAAMNDLLQPALYGAKHQVVAVRPRPGPPDTWQIVGPICESGDFIAKGRRIEKVVKGEYLSVMSAGAYGFSMSSNYNSRPRPAEVLVEGRFHRLIRRRETWDDLVKLEE